MATSYSNPGGQGDRTATITVTSNFTPQGTMSNAVDGASGNNSTDSFGFSATTTGNTITFDFGVGAIKIIDEFTWVQQNATSQGTWKWSWSNDGSTFTDLTTGIAIAGASSTTVATVTSRLAGARYYRLTQTGGTTSSSPWVQEVTFKIDDALATRSAVLTQTVPAFTQTLTGSTIKKFSASQTINPFGVSALVTTQTLARKLSLGLMNVGGGRHRRA